MSQNKSKSESLSSNVKTGMPNSTDGSLLFGKKNYMYILGGVLLIFIGFLLMSGGSMPSNDVWDENLIYSFRRITLAPIVILAGLIVTGVAIFIKK